MQPSPWFTGEWKLVHEIINIPNDAQRTRINTQFWYDNCKNRLPKLWHQHKITNPVHGRFIQHLRGQPFTARHGRLYNERRWCLSYEEVKQCGFVLGFYVLSVFLGGLDQVVHVDVEIVIVFDVVDRRLGGNLVDDEACSLHTFIRHILHLLTHKALCFLTGLPVCRQQVFILCGDIGVERLYFKVNWIN